MKRIREGQKNKERIRKIRLRDQQREELKNEAEDLRKKFEQQQNRWKNNAESWFMNIFAVIQILVIVYYVTTLL